MDTVNYMGMVSEDKRNGIQYIVGVYIILLLKAHQGIAEFFQQVVIINPVSVP
jgi:hypothetical protein